MFDINFSQFMIENVFIQYLQTTISFEISNAFEQ